MQSGVSIIVEDRNDPTLEVTNYRMTHACIMSERGLIVFEWSEYC